MSIRAISKRDRPSFLKQAHQSCHSPITQADWRRLRSNRPSTPYSASSWGLCSCPPAKSRAIALLHLNRKTSLLLIKPTAQIYADRYTSSTQHSNEQNKGRSRFTTHSRFDQPQTPVQSDSHKKPPLCDGSVLCNTAAID